MTSQITNLYAQLAAAPVRKSTPKPPAKNDDLHADVRLVIGYTPRIEVTFNRYPGPSIITDLKAAGFKWNPPSWTIADSEKARAFCNARFDHPLPPYNSADFNTPAPEAPKPAPKIIVAPERAKTDWETYTQQIDELLTYFRAQRADYAASDLQLAAIAAYHKAVFSQN